jgi:Fe-S cluster biogenesis protein NfuA
MNMYAQAVASDGGNIAFERQREHAEVECYLQGACSGCPVQSMVNG